MKRRGPMLVIPRERFTISPREVAMAAPESGCGTGVALDRVARHPMPQRVRGTRQISLGRLWLALASAIVLVVVWGDPASAAAGDVDPTFGGDGWVFTLATPRNTAGAMVIQPDGRIVVVGTWGSQLAIWRYLSSGQLDPAFGQDGVRTVWVGYHRLLVHDAVRQPDGKLVVGGQIGKGAMIARLLPDGSLDPNFGGGDGVVTIDPPEQTSLAAFRVRTFPDGGILAGVTRITRFRLRSFLISLSADGSPDPAFGRGGKLPVGKGVPPIALESSGILVAGPDPTSTHRVAVTRYLMDGTLDASFGTGGIGSYSLGSDVYYAHATAIATDGLGRIILAGAGSIGSCFFDSTEVLRLTPDGQRDSEFTPFSSCFDAVSLLPSTDGSIGVVGSVFAGAGSGEYHIWLSKLLTDGLPDAAFGDGGSVVAAPEQWYWLWAGGADRQPDGKIVVLARASYQPAFLLARFLVA